MLPLQFRANVSPTLNEDDSMGSDQNATQDHEPSNLHNRSSSSLNIQGNTFQASKTNNLSVPVITDRPIESRSVFGLSLMLANTMSLAPKIDTILISCRKSARRSPSSRNQRKKLVPAPYIALHLTLHTRALSTVECTLSFV